MRQINPEYLAAFVRLEMHRELAKSSAQDPLLTQEQRNVLKAEAEIYANGLEILNKNVCEIEKVKSGERINKKTGMIETN